jgi:hypothetical protein
MFQPLADAPSEARAETPAPSQDVADGAAAIAQAAETQVDRRPYVPITQVTADTDLPSGLAPGMPGSEIKQSATPVVRVPTFGDVRLDAGWAVNDFEWLATAMKHKPLYFEDVNAERYGYTVSPLLQPAISGAHFFANVAALPYKMTTHPPCECIYTLGHYRPGDCAPRRWHHEPLDAKAAAVEAGVVVGLVGIVP